MVRGQVCIQRTRNEGLGMPNLESHWLAERLAYLGRSLTGDAVWRRKASRTFPHLKSEPKAEGRRKPMGETAFVREYRAALRNIPGTSDLSGPRKELHRELVVDSASERAVRLDGRGDPLPLELDARIEFLEPLRVLAHLATCTKHVTPSRLGL